MCAACAFTVATILLYIGVVTSIIIFPLGIAALILYCIKYKEKGSKISSTCTCTCTLTPPPTVRCVVISFGITGSVIVFPIGLVLLLVAYCCCRGKESDDQPHMQFQDCKFVVFTCYHMFNVVGQLMCM